MKPLLIMIGIAGWLLNESALARDAQWFERRMGELDKALLLGDEKQKIEALGEFVSIGTVGGMDEQQTVIFNKAKSALLAIPGHAKFIQNKIESTRAQLLVDIKKSDKEIYQMRLDKTMVEYRDYEDSRRLAFPVLGLLPDGESVAVLGHFLDDPEGADGKNISGETRFGSDYAQFVPNAQAAAIALGKIGIENPPSQAARDRGFYDEVGKGEIAGLSGAADDARYFQISVPLQPGNSGGALVDERGNVVGVVSAKLNAVAALAASGALPENVNYAVKSSFLLGFLESVPTVVSELKEPNTQEEKFENVVQSVERAAVLVLNTSNKPTAGNSPPQAPTEAPSTVPDAPPAPPQPQGERKEREPAAALPEIPEKLAAALIGAFFLHGEGNDMQLELADYADVVNPYFDQGRMTRQGIAKDLSTYRAQWRDRSFQLLQVESASKTDANTLEATYQLQFRASDGKKARTGVLRQSIHYTRAGDRWLVSGIQTIERVSK
jgi:hypothetical protein